MLRKTGLTIADHQRLTVERYDTLVACDLSTYIMPVLQGYNPADYAAHIMAYGQRLRFGAWVGVGSVCKRNTDPAAIEAVLIAIKSVRPDLRLHGFGVKLTALQSGTIRALLHSADSMAWSFAARRNGRNANDWREARRFADAVEGQSYQLTLTAIMLSQDDQDNAAGAARLKRAYGPYPTNNARYYARRAAGLCPECGRPSGIWVFCAACRGYHRKRVTSRERPA